MLLSRQLDNWTKTKIASRRKVPRHHAGLGTRLPPLEFELRCIKKYLEILLYLTLGIDIFNSLYHLNASNLVSPFKPSSLYALDQLDRPDWQSEQLINYFMALNLINHPALSIVIYTALLQMGFSRKYH